MGKKGQFWRTLKEFMKENLLELSLLLGIIALFFFFFSAAAWFKPGVLRGGFADMADGMDNWKYPLLFISGGAVGVCIFLSYSNWKKRANFEEMIDTDSKAEFIKTLDDLEYVAYQLGPKYEEKVWEKKQTFKIK